MKWAYVLCDTKLKLRPYYVDLHIHTVLSPCGELEMGAHDIVSKARQEGIQIIAITDHNSALNVPAITKAAGGSPVVIPGLEVQTAEDIHIVTLFRDCQVASDYQRWLWERMPGLRNRPEVFGDQLVISEKDDILDEEEILLVQGVGYSVDEVALEAKGRGGLVILAHIDRPSFSYTAVLGPIPSSFPADALEISWRCSSEEVEVFREEYPEWTFIRSSDSHWLRSLCVENCSVLLLAEPTFDEIAKAIRKEDGRCVIGPWPNYF
ncbi:MAG: PHP domain-containing protein [Aminobacterium colombiense]|jgi:PHP family Zn ribbon phosphoesterase|uniref:PHP domain protein n=2 Tax=Aminobacteriaceae TaxID=3029087 RepID=D5EE29_AMICL|nr:PHP domain protein [Aminobacterium colombiense DSM 12261]MDD3767682.1 PHP domain-containing protein [Aminobacterium colombiense]MDD4264967.1 PHP domain-containing protein [Aminobacterium colombiense]NLK29769.1 PHP domain-containing protein [Aminobacterium colombiense]